MYLYVCCSYVDFLVLTHTLSTYVHACPSCGSSVHVLAYLPMYIHTYVLVILQHTHVPTHITTYHTHMNTVHIIGLLLLLFFNCPCSCFYSPAVTKEADIPLGEEDPDCKGDEGSC